MFDLRPLRSASFRRLTASLWINEAGNAIGEVALALLVYDRTGNPLASAALFLTLRVLPAVLAPLLTTYVEAMRPRLVLSTIYVLEAGLFAGVAAISHHFSLPLVLVLVAIDGVLAVASATLMRSAITNNLMAANLLREGNGLVNVGTMVAFAAGPITAGAVIAAHGVGTALILDSLSFLIAAIVMITAPGVHIASDSEAGAKGRFKTGAEVVRRRPTVRRLFIAITLTVGISSVAVPIEVVFAQTTLHAGSSGYGWLLTSWGIGMILGGAVFALAPGIRLMLMLGCSSALVALGYGGLALSPTLAIACVFSFIGGSGNGAAWVAAMTAIQEQIPLNAQSAVMSMLYGLNQLVPGIGFIVGGIVTSIGSPRIAYAISAVGTGLAVLTFVIRPINRVPLTPAEDLPPRADDLAPAAGPSHSEDLPPAEDLPPSPMIITRPLDQSPIHRKTAPSVEAPTSDRAR